jgi:hypothetical protein
MDQDVVGIRGVLADLVDPGVVVSKAAVNVRQLVVHRDEVVFSIVDSLVRRTWHPFRERFVIRKIPLKAHPGDYLL